MTGPIAIITIMWDSMIASPNADVTSPVGAPRRVGHGTSTAPALRSRNVPTPAAIEERCEWTMLIGIRAGFIPMNMTM